MCVAVLLYFIEQMCHNLFAHFIADDFFGLFLVCGYVSKAVMNITVPGSTWACIVLENIHRKETSRSWVCLFSTLQENGKLFSKGLYRSSLSSAV